jgi:hypothetical protein
MDTFSFHLLYYVYATYRPSVFRRKRPTPPPSTIQETHDPDHLVDVIATSELNEGSTGIVHIGTMYVWDSGLTIPVAVKLAFSKGEKATLIKEHNIYCELRSRVSGIPRDIGLFVGEDIDGGEGPYALVLTFAGVSLLGTEKLVSSSVRYAFFCALFIYAHP